MAGSSVTRNVQVNVIGDSTSGRAASTSLAAEAESTGSRISAAFHNAMGTLSGIAGGAFGPITEAFDSLDKITESWSEKGKTTGTVMLGIGAAAAGAGGALMAMGSADKQAQDQLAQAIQNTGNSYSDYKDEIEKTISSQAKFGYTASQTQNALQTLTQASGDPKKAIDLMGEAADLAAAKHIGLTDAANILAQVLNGKGTKTLTQFGITQQQVKAAGADHTVILQLLADKINGQASAASDNFTGKLRGLRAEIENHVAAFGEKYGPALTAAGAGMSVLGGTVEGVSAIMSHFKDVEDAGAIAEGLKTAAEGVETAAETADAAASGALAVGETAADVAGAPLLLIVGAITAAVAVLGFGIYELATHWSQVMSAIGAAAADAWHFIDSTFVQPVEGFFGSVVGFIQSHWQLLLAILSGPIGLAVLFIKDHFNEILDFIKGVPGAIVGFFSTIGSDFAKIGKDIVDGIVAGVKSAGSAIWDAIKSSVPGSGVIGSALSAIGLADGGIVTSPTLAMIGEAGYPEAVIPLKGGATIQGFNDAVAPLTSFGDPGGSSVPTGPTSGPASGYAPLNIPVTLTLDGQVLAQVMAQPVRQQLIRDGKGYVGTTLT